MTYQFKTKGTCSKSISIALDGDIVQDIQFEGGCNGNLKGIASIVRGMKAEEVIARCQGIRCGMRSTSCPDQLAIALKEAIAKE